MVLLVLTLFDFTCRHGLLNPVQERAQAACVKNLRVGAQCAVQESSDSEVE